MNGLSFGGTPATTVTNLQAEKLLKQQEQVGLEVTRYTLASSSLQMALQSLQNSAKNIR